MIGIVLGITAIMAGIVMEGGKLHSALQLTAAVIVFGGTLGATLVSYPLQDVLSAGLSLRDIFREKRKDPEIFLQNILQYSNIARRNGLIALEPEVEFIHDYYLRKALKLAVDGVASKSLKEMLEQENITYAGEKRRVAKVYETAGGFAPTIGILGAVLGLIHVMENLSDPSKLGAGIAVAFVATIYGVGSANLILLPVAKKLINRLNSELALREMIIEGIIGIQSGINPHYLEEKLRVYMESGSRE
jgi:chemotaxis protein MotA